MMKSKFENELKKEAYGAVPDGWDEVKKKASVFEPSVIKETGRKAPLKGIIAAAAALAVVIGAGLIIKNAFKNPVPYESIKSQAAADEGNNSRVESTELYPEEDEFDSLTVPEISEYGQDSFGFNSDSIKENGEETQSVKSGTSLNRAVTKKSDISAETADETADKKENITEKRTAVNNASIETTTRRAISETVVEMATERNWNERVLPGQYRAVVFEGREYVYPFSAVEARPTERTGQKSISGLTVTGYEPGGEKHETKADIYNLDGFDKEFAVGVKFSGHTEIYPYINTSYSPSTVGSFINAVDYDNTVTYGNIKLYKDGVFPVNSRNKADIKKYLLSGKSTAISQRSAPEGKYVSLSINLYELGIQNKSFRIYENGYVYTNLIGYPILFNAGRDNVAAFLKESYNITFKQIDEVNSAPAPAPGGTTVTAYTATEITSKAHTVEE